jgi:hypothetical protein
MELDRTLLFKIRDMNCAFRTIYEKEVSQEYIAGLMEQTKYIENIPADVSISKQKKYIKDTLNNKIDTISGLFINGELVGTAGVQQSLSESFLRNTDVNVDNLATVGIFIFNKKFRGLGIGKATVWAATSLFYKCTKIEWFGAGMEKENIPSYKSFLSCGYHDVLNKGKYYKVMINISDLKKPEFVKEEMVK